MYRDSILKIDFFKTNIIKELTRRGLYPDDITIQSRIDNIDERLSIFRYIESAPGTIFNTEKLNKDMEYIWQDLYILYKLTHELAVKEYVSLKAYVDSHLSELEDMARKYSYRAQLEIGSISLGKTIFFQASGYDVSYVDNTMIISLGKITVTKGSKLAFIFKADNIENDKVIFTLGDKNCSPYDYNHDFLKVPGEINSITYDFSLPNDSIISSSFQLSPKGLTPKMDNQYIIFAGKDTIALYDSSSNQSFIKKQKDNACSVANSCRIEFYVYGGSFITFDFSKQPISKNFSENTITNLKKRHKIIFECDANFAFDFTTDGQVFAVREDGIIIADNKLYYPTSIQLRDFMIEEFLPGDKVVYDNVTATIVNTDNNPALINTIAIKELSSVEAINS